MFSQHPQHFRYTSSLLLGLLVPMFVHMLMPMLVNVLTLAYAPVLCARLFQIHYHVLPSRRWARHKFMPPVLAKFIMTSLGIIVRRRLHLCKCSYHILLDRRIVQ